MPPQPSGTITFLFTDIEGSTRLWESQPAQMRRSLARHDRILRKAIESRDGYVFKTVGDAFCASFVTALDCLQAALDAQAALAAEAWEVTGGIRVRMALHTGTAEERDGDYFGQTLNRVARLLGIGYGAQILVSLVTEELLRDILPDAVALRDVGEHRLKDLMRPEKVYQVFMPGLRAEFPALKSLDNHPNNLPLQPTPFVGRQKELDAVQSLLQNDALRVLTLTGAGGTGKTRLSLQAAANLSERYEDGIWFVDLSAIDTPAYVIPAIARTLELREVAGRTHLDLLADFSRHKRMLLILDNFEQIAGGEPFVVQVLAACPALKLIVTSREALHLRGEQVFPVPPLSCPGREPAREATLVHLHQFEAVTLFIERAQAVRPDFFATNENAPAIAEICARLDGLPLAIELAAARVSLLTPLSILERLGRILDLPSTYTDLPHRQRTLRSTIDWSYRLLNGLEKTLLRESSVFAGGATLEALENVCTCGGEGPGPILQTLSALVSKSLLVLDDRSGSPRFVKMESIREFALELLDRDGAAAAVRQAHARYFLELVETTEQMLRGERQKESFDSLERELVNIRSALDWMMESHDTESELRLCGSMGLFWQVRGYLSEGIESCARALAEKPPGPAPARARALLASGMLARALGDPERAAAALRESAVLYESAGDPLRLGLAYSYLGWSLYSANRLKEARESFLKLRRKGAEENPLLTANMELGLATVDLREGANDSARERLERSVQLFTAAGDTRQLAQAIGNLGLLSHGRGALHDSLGLMLRALSLQESLGDKDDLVIGHYNAGELLRELGEPARAIHYYEKAIARAARMGRRRMQSIALCGLAESHLATGEAARAADSARAALGVADGGSLEAGMAHLALGDIALSQGLAAEAKKQFETAQPLLDKASASEEAARAKAGVEAARSLVSKRKTRC